MSQVFSDAIFSQMNEPSNISNHLLKQPRSRLPDKGEFFKIGPDLGPRDEFSQKSTTGDDQKMSKVGNFSIKTTKPKFSNGHCFAIFGPILISLGQHFQKSQIFKMINFKLAKNDAEF